MSIQEVKAQGKNAYLVGVSRLHGNPFVDGSAKFKAWVEGWNEAQRERWDAAK